MLLNNKTYTLEPGEHRKHIKKLNKYFTIINTIMRMCTDKLFKYSIKTGIDFMVTLKHAAAVISAI